MKLKIWEKFENMSAIKLDNLFYLNARELERPTYPSNFEAISNEPRVLVLGSKNKFATVLL